MTPLALFADHLRRTYLDNGGAVVSSNRVEWNSLKPEVRARWIAIANEALEYKNVPIQKVIEVHVPEGTSVVTIHEGNKPVLPMTPDLGVADLRATQAPAVSANSHDEDLITSDMKSIPGRDYAEATRLLSLISNHFKPNNSLVEATLKAQVQRVIELLS